MKGLVQVCLLSIFVIVLAGCGANKVSVRPEISINIQSIALIQINEPDSYVAQDFGNPGMMFGAAGGAIAGSSSANAGKNINQIVLEQKYAAGKHFTQLLKEKLSALGYRVKLISVTRSKNQDLLESYDAVDAFGADAILDVAIESIGYATEHPMFSPHWRPASKIKVALVDKRTNNTIYTEKFMYGYHNPFMSGTDIEADQAYHFKNKDELFADSNRIVAGIRRSVEDVVDKIQANLKK